MDEKIYIGSVDTPILSFDETQIESLNCDNAVDIVGDELSSDVLEVGVFFDDTDDILKSTEYGTPIFYYSNGALVGKYYVTNVKREGVRKYKIYSTSLVGLYGAEDFYGGFYNGVNFSDALNDIMFTDSASLTKWDIYDATNGNGTYLQGSRVYGGTTGDTFDDKYWNYKTFVDFTVKEPQWSSASSTSYTEYVIGLYYSGIAYQEYTVKWTAYRANASSPTYYTVSACCSQTYTRVTFGSTDNPLFGVGSRFAIYLDPTTRTISAKIHYKKYDDLSVEGDYENTVTYANTYGSGYMYLGVGFGHCVRNSAGHIAVMYSYATIYHAQKMYDETGKLVMNVVAAYNEGNSAWYIVNTVDGTALANNKVVSNGPLRGVVGGFTRYERDLELYDHILYGDGVDELLVYGWIDICTKREALHQLLFAQNVSLLKTDDGDFLFTAITDASPEDLDELNFYDDSTEEGITAAKQVKITEYAYELEASSSKVFDNTNAPLVEGEYIAIFDKSPISGTPVGNGITIRGYNCNAAIVTGRGTITATVYNKSENVIKYTNSNVRDGKDISVSGIGLITGQNSDNIMNRLKAYYSGKLKEITNSIVYNGEKCGVKYKFKTLYDDENTGFLSKISARVSSFVKAVCTFISGYVPPKIGGYSAFQIVTNGNTFVVPAEVRTSDYPNIRLNLIGKGLTGSTGENGEAGDSVTEQSGYHEIGADGGAGGAGGEGGSGGKIYVVTVDSTNVNKVVVSTSGNEIIAKTYNDSNSLLNTYSSASGLTNDAGLLNVLDGKIYGRKGAKGIDGANGGKGGSIDGVVRYGASGGNVGSKTGGQSFSDEYVDYFIPDHGARRTTCFYGGGGGASYGNNGGNSVKTGSDAKNIYTRGGNGANGGTARTVYTEYGCGGTGGNGGGGGGGAGVRITDAGQQQSGTGTYTFSQSPGAGGTGGAGGPGVEGCVLIYY